MAEGCGGPGSAGQQAAVDDEFGAGDERGGVGGQVQGGRGDLGGCAEAAHGLPGDQPGAGRAGVVGGGQQRATQGESTVPGQTQLARTPVPAYCTATWRVNAMTAPLLAQ